MRSQYAIVVFRTPPPTWTVVIVFGYSDIHTSAKLAYPLAKGEFVYCVHCVRVQWMAFLFCVCLVPNQYSIWEKNLFYIQLGLEIYIYIHCSYFVFDKYGIIFACDIFTSVVIMKTHGQKLYEDRQKKNWYNEYLNLPNYPKKMQNPFDIAFVSTIQLETLTTGKTVTREKNW